MLGGSATAKPLAAQLMRACRLAQGCLQASLCKALAPLHCCLCLTVRCVTKHCLACSECTVIFSQPEGPRADACRSDSDSYRHQVKAPFPSGQLFAVLTCLDREVIGVYEGSL